jgi:hypothetical protein
LFIQYKLAILTVNLLRIIIMNNGIKILWLISVGAAFFLGYFVNPTVKSNQGNTLQLIEQPKTEGGNTQTQANTPVKETTQQRKLTIATQAKPDLSILVYDLKNLLGGSQLSIDMASIAEAYGLIENLTKDELLTTLNLMKGELSKQENLQLLSLLAGRLATLGPIEAVNFIENNIGVPQVRITAMMSALSSWVKDDPVSAYYWYIDPNNGHESNNTFSSIGLLSIFNGLGSQDANGAFDKLTELDSSGKDTMMAAMGFSQSLENKEDFVQFLERSDEIDNLKIKDAILSSWVLKNPLETIEWSDSIEGKGQQKKIQSTIFTSWSSSEPTNAANWYIEKADESEKQSHANKIIQKWSMVDPNAALTWLDQQTTFDIQKPIVKLLSSSTYNNPTFAIDNLERLTNAKDKADISFSVYQSLERSSMTKAKKFLASSPYKKEIIRQQQSFKKYSKKNNFS